MDILSKEAIEDSLTAFDGTILLVSHDRYLLDKIATCIVAVEDRRLRRFNGNFSEFWVSELSLSRQLGGKVASRAKERSQFQADRKKKRSRIAGSNTRIAELERRLTELEGRKLHAEREVSDAFATGDHVKGRKLSNTLAKVSRQLDALYEEWEEATHG